MYLVYENIYFNRSPGFLMLQSEQLICEIAETETTII